ncbi:hypothetical protein cypCar_00048097 [Cyprinus carpio]|nr:hypothetical protein cypCar_00048097 [Cyprinus carpio]
MSVVESLLQFSSTGTLLGALLLLLVLYLLSSGSKSQKEGKEPPGPKPLPLLGNLLTLDLTRPFDTFCELSKTYGNIFQVFLGPRRTVVLVGYKTVKEALVNHAEEFGDRHISPNFRLMNEHEKPFDTTRPVNYAVSNIISSIVYGSRFEYTDPRFTEMKSGKKDSYFHEENLMVSVTNLFVAGTDTTGTTLRWGLMLMAKYPHIQDRVQEEIDRVIGGRQPVVEDRKKLPYTDAVIHETQRLANIVPLNLPHMTSCDVTFNGYFIKKGTTVVPLLTSVLKDPSEWEKPNSFYPEHFLNEKGQFVKRDAFMPFSAGRRVCLGESLARMELFLFFTSLLQSYRFTTPPGVSGDELDLKGVVGITLNPSPHKLCAIRRS